MAIQSSNIADLVTGTLNQLGRGKWTDDSSKYRRTVAAKILLKKGKMKFDNGKAVSFNRMNALSNSARFVGMYAPDIIDVTNQMGTGEVPWRHVTNNWAMDFREPLMNSGESQIFDLIKTRRIASMGSMVELFERAAWRVPATTNDTDIYGIPYWIVKSNTAATYANNNGFNGLVPSGYTTVGGFNPTTDDKWRNYATQYTIVSKDDFVRKARRMAEMTQFEPIVEDIPQYASGEPAEYYTNNDVYSTLVEILESQNENLGMSIAPYENKVMFMGTKVNNIPELQEDTTNPFYQIDWSVFGAMGLRGATMKETSVPIVGGQHTVSATFVDSTLNTLCYDRRKCGILSTDVTMPA